MVTDFEFSNGQFDNTSSAVYDDQGDVISWEYNKIDFKELDEGPDDCASGDMCWGTNIFDEDYTNDLNTDPNPYTDQFEF